MNRCFRIEITKKKGERPVRAWRWSIGTAQEYLATVIAARRRRKNPKAQDVKDARAMIRAAEATGRAEMFRGRVSVAFRAFY